MASTPAYLEFLHESLAPLGAITARKMMGGHVLYCDGTVFALVAENTLYLKADTESREAFIGRGLEQFTPFADQPSMKMGYFQPPPEFFEEREALMTWGQRAIDAGLRGAKRKTPKPVPKKARKTAAKKPRQL